VARESIAVRGAPAVQVELKLHGTDPFFGRRERAHCAPWVGGNREQRISWIACVDRARNWKEFEAACPWKVPSENIVYADREGTSVSTPRTAPLRKTGRVVAGPRKGDY